MIKQRVKEYGDFQTPVALARDACALLARRGVHPRSIVEPTCGLGSFLNAAVELFSEATQIVGLDINHSYVERAAESVRSATSRRDCRIVQGDFFEFDWQSAFADLREPLLIIGNPPWVTNSALGVMKSGNLPNKGNFQKMRGIEAITGKSNFDIAEWMLIRLMECLTGRRGTVAMLCKTSTARKALTFAWKNSHPIEQAAIYLVDAKTYFGAAVDACLLVASFSEKVGSPTCRVYSSLIDNSVSYSFGLFDGGLVANLDAYKRWQHLFGANNLKWRSGVKHDCARVFELQRIDGAYCNGLGERVEIEDAFVFPMYKSSEIAKGASHPPRRWMIVPQRCVSDDTNAIRETAPSTWDYLVHHGAMLDRRASSIYRKRARFAVFGVGSYTFSRWKVAIGALYKRLRFTPVGPRNGQPVVLDDTCYFLPCRNKAQAHGIADILNSPVAIEALSSYVFFDAKRPVTTDVLNRLSLPAIARQLGWDDHAIARLLPHEASEQQKSLF